MSGDTDFRIELDRDGDRYRVHVRSPAGEDTAHVVLDPAELVGDLHALQTSVLASAARVRLLRPVMSGLEPPLRQVGTALFEAVLSGKAGALLLASRNEVERRGEQLRVVLRLPPELAVLPWELLFDPHHGGYVCRRSALVRYVDVPEPVRPLAVDPPLRVLGMTALPGTLAALDAEAEQQRLVEVLAPLEEQGLVALDWVQGQRWEDLQGALYGGCHLFHFIGHGGFDADRGEGLVAFADAHGRARRVPASALAELLSIALPMPRLVVLNSCETAAGLASDVFSSTGAALVRRVPAVVAMQFSITDDAATAFSGAFYQALAHNRGVDEAVRAGRIALTGWHTDTLEWVTPVLYMRSLDTHLFTLTPQPGRPFTRGRPLRRGDQPRRAEAAHRQVRGEPHPYGDPRPTAPVSRHPRRPALADSSKPDFSRQSITINAPLDAVAAVITDFSAYPEWVDTVKSVEILEEFEDGYASQVRFVVDGGINKDDYVLEYAYAEDVSRIEWNLVRGQTQKSQQGSYDLEDNGDGTTTVTYSLAVELNIPMLRMFKRKAEQVITDTALKELKKRVEP